MQETVLILGANGRFGRAAAQAFAKAGWHVIAQARRPLADQPIPGAITQLQVDAADTGSVVAAARQACVVVNAMNPLYTRWDTEALALNASAIAVARQVGATLMLPGNVYNFGETLVPVLTEEAPQHPTNPKGRIRCAMEGAMREDGLRSIVVRAGDFFGGDGMGTWFDQAVVKDISKGKITYPGPLDVIHEWVYLPDLAQTFVLLAQVRGTLGAHETFHLPGHAITGQALADGLMQSARGLKILSANQQARIGSIPWPLVRLVGLVHPMWRELARMRYLWRRPHQLAGARLGQVIGTVPHTPLPQALTRALQAWVRNQHGSSPRKVRIQSTGSVQT